MRTSYNQRRRSGHRQPASGNQHPASRNQGHRTQNRKPGNRQRDAGDRRPDKSLGQNFLQDRNILAIEAELAEPEGKVVLEIGPGDGRLTDALLARNPAKLIAVEKDPRFAGMLRQKFQDSRKIEIIEGDFLEAALPEKVDVIVGNIPYYISSDIVFHLKSIGFGKAVLMVQKEFAQRMVARPGDGNYGRLSVTAQLHFDIRLERKVLRHLFKPMPDVDSAIITLKPTGFRMGQLQENLIRWMFQHKNKIVRNALIDSKMFQDGDLRVLGPFLKRRARTLSKEECLEIAKRLESV